MGIIAKQSIKGSAYTYAGAIVGFINTGLLMPNFFDKKEVGLVFLLIAITLIFSQFANLGFPYVNTRFFPFFRNKKKHNNGILTLGVFVTFCGIFISLAVFYFMRYYFVSDDYDSSGILAQNIYYVPILIIFTTFFSFFDSYAKSLFDAVIGIFLRDFLVKLLNFITIILFIYHFIDFEKFVLLYVFSYISPFFIILITLIIRKQIFFNLPDKDLLKKYKNEIIKVAVFGVVSGFSGIAIMNIDKAMVTDFIGIDEMGVYAVCFYFGVLISLPAKPLRKIASIIIAEAWKKNNKDEISSVYRKSISNLVLIGVFIYVEVVINIDNIFEIIPDYISGRNIILLIGAAYLIDMFSGTSAIIISSSRYYKVHAYVMLITIVLVIVTNLVFIPMWQLVGAAFASLITIIIASFIRFMFLLKKFNLQPYFYKHFLIIGIGAFMLVINFYIPKVENIIFDIFIRSSLIGISFICLSYFLKVSPDANNFYISILKKLRK